MFGGSDSGDGLMYTQLKKFISVIVSRIYPTRASKDSEVTLSASRAILGRSGDLISKDRAFKASL